MATQRKTVKSASFGNSGYDAVQALPLAGKYNMRQIVLTEDGDPKDITLGASTTVIRVTVMPGCGGVDIGVGPKEDYISSECDTILTVGKGGYSAYTVTPGSKVTLAALDGLAAVVKIAEY